MSCTDIITFYRVCGHTYKGSRHSDPCLKARDGTWSECWNPLPPKIKRHYFVQHCEHCLAVLLQDMSADDVEDFHGFNLAFRRQDTGDNPRCINPGVYSGEEIVRLAFIARAEQENYEVCTRRQTRLRLIEEEQKNDDREAEWNNDLKRYLVEPGRKSLWIIHANHRDNKPNKLFAEVHGPFEDNTCLVCQEDLEDLEDLTVSNDTGNVLPNLARKLPCGHIFHQPCIERWLISSDEPCCPYCRKHYQVVCCNGFDEPVYRWYPDVPEYRQVSGYVPFPKPDNVGMAAYKWGEEPDRWGDLIQSSKSADDPAAAAFHAPRTSPDDENNEQLRNELSGPNL